MRSAAQVQMQEGDGSDAVPFLHLAFGSINSELA
jgi:hypothetical protein